MRPMATTPPFSPVDTSSTRTGGDTIDGSQTSPVPDAVADLPRPARRLKRPAAIASLVGVICGAEVVAALLLGGAGFGVAIGGWGPIAVIMLSGAVVVASVRSRQNRR